MWSIQYGDLSNPLMSLLLHGLRPRKGDGCPTDLLGEAYLPPPNVHFCDQHEETLDHPLPDCAFARTMWHQMFSLVERASWTPLADTKLVDWWCARPPATRRDETSTLWCWSCRCFGSARITLFLTEQHRRWKEQLGSMRASSPRDAKLLFCFE
jgi:hypothetical protein